MDKRVIAGKVLTALAGAMYGIASVYIALIAVLFIAHPDSAPGTKEWEEDSMFIPIGYVMAALWAAADILIFVKLKRRRLLFFVFMILSAAALCGYFFLSLNRIM